MRPTDEPSGATITVLPAPVADVCMLRRVVDDVWHDGRLDLIAEFYEPDYVGHDPCRRMPIFGHDGRRQQVYEFRSAFPDLRIAIEDLTVACDRLTYRYTTRGTHSGRFGHLEPTGTKVALTGVEIIRFGSGGQIAEAWNWWDALGLLRQLRVVESDSL